MSQGVSILEKCKRMALAAMPGTIMQRGILRFPGITNDPPRVILIATSRPAIAHLLKYRHAMGSYGSYKYYMIARIPNSTWAQSYREIMQLLATTDVEPIPIARSTAMKWDVKVLAENIPYRPIAAPILHIGHGNGFKSLDGGKTKYPFEGKLFADKMLEQRKSVISAVEESLPIYQGRFVWTGHKDAAQVKHALSEREAIRDMMGIEKDQVVIMVWGSFRSESLFHALGTPLLDYLERLPKERYRIILSIHPQEYERYDENIEPLGPVIDSFATKEGFIVRNPNDDYVSYIVACDLMICDHSSALDIALLAQRPLALLEVTKNIWKQSDYTKLLEYVPVIRNIADVDKAIKEILSEKYTHYQDVSRMFAKELESPDCGYDTAVREATKALVAQKKSDVSMWKLNF